MFKQMVEFSKKLQESGFYDSLFENNKQFLYVVIKTITLLRKM